MKETQGRRLIAALKKKPHTYLEMQMLGISTSPQKRVMESLQEWEYVDRRYKLINGRKLVTWQVQKVIGS